MATLTPQQRPPTIFTLPNQLTAARLVLSVVLFALISGQEWSWCLVVFAVAAFTDWLDGYLARLQGLATALGRVFDPLVDKVLVCGAFIFLLPYGSQDSYLWLAPWMVTVVVTRELVITSLRSALESVGAQFGADWLGKLKMGLQCAALIAIFVHQLDPVGYLSFWTGWARDGFIWAMLLATILSGLQYLWRGLLLFKSDTQKASL